MAREIWTITIVRDLPEVDPHAVVEPQIGFQEPEFDQQLRMFIDAMLNRHQAVVEGYLQTEAKANQLESQIVATLHAAGMPQAAIDNVLRMFEERSRGEMAMFKDSPPRKQVDADRRRST